MDAYTEQPGIAAMGMNPACGAAGWPEVQLQPWAMRAPTIAIAATAAHTHEPQPAHNPLAACRSLKLSTPTKTHWLRKHTGHCRKVDAQQTPSFITFLHLLYILGVEGRRDESSSDFWRHRRASPDL